MKKGTWGSDGPKLNSFNFQKTHTKTVTHCLPRVRVKRDYGKILYFLAFFRCCSRILKCKNKIKNNFNKMQKFSLGLLLYWSKMSVHSSHAKNEPPHDKTSNMTVCPAKTRSLIRVFAIRLKKAWVLSYPLSAKQRLWSDWVDAKADLSLRWAHRSFCRFYYEAAQILVGQKTIYVCFRFQLWKTKYGQSA